MKYLSLNLFVLLTIAVIPSYSQEIFVSDKLEKLWEVKAGLRTPESVIYDPTDQYIYVSNIKDHPWEKDKNGYISRHKANGDIINYEWVNELSAPKGMGIVQRKLYVTNIDEVVEIDMDKAQITQRLKHPKASNLNDIAVGADGRIYISDSKGNYLFEIFNGVMDVLFQSDEPTNGIFYETGRLLCGHQNTITALDLTTKTMSMFIDSTGAVDGLKGVGDSTYIISDWEGRVFLVQQGKTKLMLLDMTQTETNAADIEFDPYNRILYVPTFYKDSVIAYKLK